MIVRRIDQSRVHALTDNSKDDDFVKIIADGRSEARQRPEVLLHPYRLDPREVFRHQTAGQALKGAKFTAIHAIPA
jgi:hypothetical protein